MASERIAAERVCGSAMGGIWSFSLELGRLESEEQFVLFDVILVEMYIVNKAKTAEHSVYNGVGLLHDPVPLDGHNQGDCLYENADQLVSAILHEEVKREACLKRSRRRRRVCNLRPDQCKCCHSKTCQSARNKLIAQNTKDSVDELVTVAANRVGSPDDVDHH